MTDRRPSYGDVKRVVLNLSGPLLEVLDSQETKLKTEIMENVERLFEGKNFVLVGVCNGCEEYHRPEKSEEIVKEIFYKGNKRWSQRIPKKIMRKSEKIQTGKGLENESVSGYLLCMNYQQEVGGNKKGVIVTQEYHLKLLDEGFNELAINGSTEKIAETSLGPVCYHVYGFGESARKETQIFNYACRSMLKIPENAVIRISDLSAIRELIS